MAQYIICKAPACERTHTNGGGGGGRTPSSTTNPIRESGEPFARAKRFLYVCNDANNLYAPSVRRYSRIAWLFSLFRRCLPPLTTLFVCSFVPQLRGREFIFHARTRGDWPGESNDTIYAGVLRRRVISFLYVCDTEGAGESRTGRCRRILIFDPASLASLGNFWKIQLFGSPEMF